MEHSNSSGFNSCLCRISLPLKKTRKKRASETRIFRTRRLTSSVTLLWTLTWQSKYMLFAGALAEGGLTVIANATNPVGVAQLKRGFVDEKMRG